MSESRRFPPDTSSVRDVRRFVEDAVADLPREKLEVVLLAASELASNSVRHATTEYVVTVDRTDRQVRVTVEDQGEGTPALQDPDPSTPSGRGLLIVSQLSDAWGASSARGQNRVWFALQLEAEPTVGPSTLRTH
jgi:anti-sigma regulatory factor (Ser/Thr protein kinase)